MKVYRLPILIIMLVGIVTFAVLIYLATTRGSVPIHADVKLAHFRLRLGQPFSSDESSLILIQNVELESITLSDLQPIELIGQFFDPTTSDELKTGKLKLTPRESLASITITGMYEGSLRLEKLVVEPQAYIEITPSIAIKIAERESYANILMDGNVEIEWEGFEVQTDIEGINSEQAGWTGFRPDEAYRAIKASSVQGLLNLNMRLPNDSTCKLENELPISSLSFVQQRFGKSRPEETTTIQEAKIIMPTLPDEKPVNLPDGSYLSIGNLKDFTLKSVLIEPKREAISATLYGYTNDLRAAYGRGELMQLLPSSLLLLRKNALLLGIYGGMLWFLKHATNFYNRWKKWKEGKKV